MTFTPIALAEMTRNKNKQGTRRGRLRRARICFQQRLYLSSAIVLALIPATGHATSEFLQEEYLADAISPSMLGGIGLMATPTARMLPDGEILIGASYQAPVGTGYLTWQALPWLELTARYADIKGQVDDLDPSLDLKIRLYEGRRFPHIALGFRDALGNGAFSSEYLVFSKNFGNFDLSAGMGWGALGERLHVGNPLSFLGKNRDYERSGVPQFRDYFSGKFGFFGGIAYATPVRGLTLKLEYDGNDLRNLSLNEPVHDSFPVNIGVDYRPLSWLHMSIGLVRGNEIGASLAVRFNPQHFVPARKKFDSAPLDVPVSPLPNLTETDAGVIRLPSSNAVLNGKPLSTGLPQDALTHITRGLFMAGLEAPMIDVEVANEATITLSLQSGREERQALHAAYVAFAVLPESFDVVIIRNRLGDEVGMEGQRFTRDLVAHFARSDASFNDLMRAGGVRQVTLKGRDIEARLNSDEATRASVALSGLVEQAGEVQIETPDGLMRVDGESLTETRHRNQMTQSLKRSGLALRAFDMADGHAVISADLMKDMGAEQVQLAADTVAAILGDAVTVDLTVYRSDVPLKTVAVPMMAEVQPMMANPVASAPRLAPLSEGEAEDLFKRMRLQDLSPVAARLHGRTMSIAYTNDRFSSPAQAVGRAARAMSAGKPLDVDWLEIIQMESGLEQGRVTFLRRDFERAANHLGSPEEVWVHTTVDRRKSSFAEQDGWQKSSRSVSAFRWAIYPEIIQHFGSGADGYRGTVYGNASASINFFNNLKLSGTLSREIGGSLDQVPGANNSAVPAVRSDIARYAEDGRTALRDLRLDYTLQPSRDLYLRFSAGYFERMFGGAGLEMLYKPGQSNFAFGLDIHRVKQRDFNQRFGFQDYSVTTGQVSLYHVWQRSGVEARVHAGRYLAGDIGIGFDVSRRFANGIRVGAFATFTEMSNKAYGGDAPTKGLYLSVPLDSLLPWSWKRELNVQVRALNRNGGQMLEKGQSLHDLLTEGDAGRLNTSWRHLLN